MVKKTNSSVRPPKPPPAKRFLVIGDEVFDPATGAVRYVSAGRLIGLYGLDPAECEIAETAGNPHLVLRKDLIVLYPRNDGNYRRNGG